MTTFHQIRSISDFAWRLAALWAQSIIFMIGLYYFLAAKDVFGISMHPWKLVGLSGSVIFGVRFLLQWIASEKVKKSVIPIGFWECSALGSLLLLSYFAIYQRDSVGVITTFLPLPIYLRNLYFVWRDRLKGKKKTAVGEGSKSDHPDL